MEPVSDSTSARKAARSPTAEYSFQVDALERLQRSAARRGRVFGISKLLLAAFTLIAAGFLIHHVTGLLMLLAPVAAFIVLVVLHEKMLQGIRWRARAIRFYQDGLARLRDEWRGRGESGNRFLDAAHPYARDLDVFGADSVFQYLSTARTRSGEETLARWLLRAADVKEVLARQAAVKELGPRVSLREELASCGEDVRAGVDAEVLAAWGESGPVLSSVGTRVATTGLGILWLASLAAWPLYGMWTPVLLMSVANVAYAHKLFLRLERAAEAIEKAAAELRLLGEVLALLEREEFAAAKLKDLQAVARTEARSASREIWRLARLADTIASRHNRLVQPLDPVLFWSAQFVFAAERWQGRYGRKIRGWLEAAGALEALASLGAFAFEHPEYAFAEFVDEGPLFEAEGLGHPLLPVSKAVANDVRLGQDRQLMILSGPNMAGKSTFIRAMGVNAVLAQAGAPVCARRLRMSRLNVAASICVLDSLSGGVSRFYAEIRRVKMITDMAEGPVRVLFLLDELLSGTNSHDRLIGTEYVLRELVERSAIGVVSTHDLALARIPDGMGGRAFNAHFEDRIEEGALIFDYKLKPGVVQTSNALKLMRAIGLGISE
jgi:hypothetical protein